MQISSMRWVSVLEGGRVGVQLNAGSASASAGRAEGDLALIQTYLLLSSKCS